MGITRKALFVCFILFAALNVTFAANEKHNNEHSIHAQANQNNSDTIVEEHNSNSRITSYNVCYTKLLRDHRLRLDLLR